jgi:hypothetical protein
MNKGVERREFQRLHLDSPIAGTFGDSDVSVVEVGILGARIEHSAPLESSRDDLRFSFDGNLIDMRCEIVRTTGNVSGLRFLAAVGDSGDHLRDMLSRLVKITLERHHDSSATRLRIRSVDGDKTVRGSDAHFFTYQFENGAWKRRAVLLPEQPQTGFTVPRGEDAEEMQRLCEVFEASDDEGRRLIRLFAELSVSGVLRIPQQQM